MIIKQCTQLLPYDTSLYTVYGIFKDSSDSLDDINFRNDNISKELKVYLDEEYEVGCFIEVLQHFVSAMKGSTILLFSDGNKSSFDLLHKIHDILMQQGIKPLFIEANKDNEMPAWEMALLYNHTVSLSAFNGFGGGIVPPAEYKSLKDIVPKALYEKYVLSSCIDSRGVGLFWTPYTPDNESKIEAIENSGDEFNIPVISSGLQRTRKSKV